MPNKYSQSFIQRAVCMVFDRLDEEGAPGRHVVIREVAPKLYLTEEVLHQWVAQAETKNERPSDMTMDTQAELRKLRRENSDLRKANDILKMASAFFAKERDRSKIR